MALTLSQNNFLVPDAGSASAPTLGFQNSSNSGFFLKSNGVVGLTAAGSEIGSFSSTGLTLVGTLTVAGITSSALIGTKQAITNVTDALPTQAEMVTALGAANQGNGLIGVIKDNDADTNFFICLSNGTSWYALKLTKGA